MIFSSIFFIFMFLPAVIILYYIVPKQLKNVVLLLASVFFYAWGEPVYVVLMLFSIAFNYTMGLDIFYRRKSKELAKRSLIFAVVVNLFILCFFKYYGFLIDTINGIFDIQIAYKALSLPIGISFYTFQTMSYVIDVYYKKVPVQKNLLKFGVYVSMFPQLIAGPIVRYADIYEQLDERSVDLQLFGSGCENFIKGLGKKVLLANSMGKLYETIHALPPSEVSTLLAWLGIAAYTFQIYFDFSGYSDMAIGLGKMFGFRFPKNFNYPYQAKSITDFWRRWHISLSTWFREYVYIPLGGNRVAVPRHMLNLLIVWMLTGLWHGASWNFVIWGLYYGVLLIIEKYVLGRFLEKLPGWIRGIYTMVLVMIGWVFFSSIQMSAAFTTLASMFGFGSGGFLGAHAFYYVKSYLMLFVICILVCRKQTLTGYRALASRRSGLAVVANVAIVMLCIAFLVYDTYNPFLYFRF
ncbi:MAG: MBOAT family protein [Lachnospiraceae bacterium]|nr:MBOAT family protein [Lachnospiraceae bacterium]MDD3615054.1 MBOAT family protein [Lachnospiraceae bacterium]